MESFLRDVVTYLAKIGLGSLAALLLEKGTWFEGRADSDAYAVAPQWKQKTKPKAQDCFYTSQEFCAEVSGARYFEGFVLVQAGLPPEDHAWVVMHDGRVLDFTLEALEVIVADQGHIVDTTGALYVGLEIPRPFIAKRLAETAWYEAIADLFYADQIDRIANAGQRPSTSGVGRKRPPR